MEHAATPCIPYKIVCRSTDSCLSISTTSTDRSRDYLQASEIHACKILLVLLYETVQQKQCVDCGVLGSGRDERHVCSHVHCLVAGRCFVSAKVIASAACCRPHHPHQSGFTLVLLVDVSVKLAHMFFDAIHKVDTLVAALSGDRQRHCTSSSTSNHLSAR